MPDFSLDQAFHIYVGDKENMALSKRLSAGDSFAAMERLGLTCDLADATLLTARYDADEDGRLSYWEFANMFLPGQAKARSELSARKPGPVSDQTYSMFKAMLRAVLNAEAMCENLRQKLQTGVSATLRELFDRLDCSTRGFLTQIELQTFFSAFPTIQGTNQERTTMMDAFIRRFNKDKLNGRISLPEFLDELTPKQENKQY